jgi:5-formyltetrahydrofolate cyclo-ligase
VTPAPESADTRLRAAKAAMRAESAARREGLPDPRRTAALNAHLLAYLSPFAGQAVSGYWPMRSEADIRPALTALAARGPVALPVVRGRGLPLMFRNWHPDIPLVPGPYGAQTPPEDAPETVPRVLLVPLLAFDRHGWRLGYGGGFYDRTLAVLRAAGPTVAIGVAFAGQAVEAVPHDPATDARLDAVVTEDGAATFPADTPPPRT